MADHYAEAEELLQGQVKPEGGNFTPTAPAIAAANVHATLALADALNRNDAASLADQVARLERQVTFAQTELDAARAAYEDLSRRGNDERNRLQYRVERAIEILDGGTSNDVARHDALLALRGEVQ